MCNATAIAKSARSRSRTFAMVTAYCKYSVLRCRAIVRRLLVL